MEVMIGREKVVFLPYILFFLMDLKQLLLEVGSKNVHFKTARPDVKLCFACETPAETSFDTAAVLRSPLRTFASNSARRQTAALRQEYCLREHDVRPLYLHPTPTPGLGPQC